MFTFAPADPMNTLSADKKFAFSVEEYVEFPSACCVIFSPAAISYASPTFHI
jgi:hypothetical protein